MLIKKSLFLILRACRGLLRGAHPKQKNSTWVLCPDDPKKVSAQLLTNLSTGGNNPELLVVIRAHSAQF
jgi:hypothetical protein